MSLTVWLEEHFDINTIASFRQRDSDFRAKDSLGTSPEPFIALWGKKIMTAVAASTSAELFTAFHIKHPP